MTKVKYTCYAVPPKGISLGVEYIFNKDEQGCYIQKYSGSDKQYMDIELIKMLFSPVKGDWTHVLTEVKGEVKTADRSVK